MADNADQPIQEERENLSYRNEAKSRSERWNDILIRSRKPMWTVFLLSLWAISFGAGLFAWTRWVSDGLNTFLIAAVTIPVTVYGFIVAARINLKNKIMDCVIGCNLRYDDLYKERSRISEISGASKGVNSAKNYATRNYYNRYWGLKSDQFDYWLSGYVDPETMCSWFYSVMKAFATNPMVGSQNFLDGWRQSSAYHRVADPTFDKCIERLIDVAARNKHLIENPKLDRFLGSEIYLSVVRLFEKTEAEYADTIKEMTNMPLQRLIAPRQTMGAYRVHYEDGLRREKKAVARANDGQAPLASDE